MPDNRFFDIPFDRQLRHCARVTELCEELDSTQIVQLYTMLKTKTYGQWLTWLTEHQASISRYDALTRSERRKRLHAKRDNEPHALLLHHAAIWLGAMHYTLLTSFPPHAPFQMPYESRFAILNTVLAYDRLEAQLFWPFDEPDGCSDWPFAEDS